MPTFHTLTDDQKAKLQEEHGKYAENIIAMESVRFSKEDEKTVLSFCRKSTWDAKGHQFDKSLFLEQIKPIFCGASYLSLYKLAIGELTEANVKFPLMHITCWNCGEELSTWHFKAGKFSAATTCAMPTDEYTFEIDIPSGKMAVANDLRQLISLTGDAGYVNTILGCKQTSDAYAAAGMAHAFVGNTCPTVYKRITGKVTDFLIGCKSKKGKDAPKFKGFRSVASICTDLWWYSILDYDWYKKLDPTGEHEVDIITCTPGRYSFRHVYYKNRNDDGNAEIYTYVTRVGTALEPVDPYATLTYTAEDIICAGIKDDLYEGCSDDSTRLHECINHFMCSYGNGTDYHKNGWWGYAPVVAKAPPAFSIPDLKGPIRWTFFSEYSIISIVALKGVPVIHPSFVDLTYKILKHMISDDASTSSEEQKDKDGKSLKTTIRNSFKKKARALLLSFTKNYAERFDDKGNFIAQMKA